VPLETQLSRINVSGVASASYPESVPTRTVSSLVANDPEYAIGAVLVLVILSVTVPVSERFPSISTMVYSNVSTPR